MINDNDTIPVKKANLTLYPLSHIWGLITDNTDTVHHWSLILYDTDTDTLIQININIENE